MFISLENVKWYKFLIKQFKQRQNVKQKNCIKLQYYQLQIFDYLKYINCIQNTII